MVRWGPALLVLAIVPLMVGAGESGATGQGATEYGPTESAATLYLLKCSGCHGPDGMGENRADVPPLPPLVGNLLRDAQGRAYIVNVGGVVTSNLGYADTAAVLNWVLHAFGATTLPPNTKQFDADEVRALRAQRQPDSVGLRRAIAKRLQAKGIKLAPYPWP